MIRIKIVVDNDYGYGLEFADGVSRDQILREVEKALFGLEVE